MVIERFAACLLGVALLVAPARSDAAPYTAEYVFGDSLSDNGNLAEVFYRQNFPNPPSYHDSFTNGPVAAELLANRLGLSLTPSLWVTAFQDTFGLFGGTSFVPGTNYAVAAATAAAQAVGGLAGINLPQQVAAFGAAITRQADPNALYVIAIGGNDVRNAAKQGTGAAAVTAGVSAELAAIAALSGIGAKNFLIVNVPNVGVIPEFALGSATLAAAATAYSQLYDSQLASGLSALTLPSGTSLSTFDLYSFNAAILADPLAYGFTNTTTPCYTMTPLLAATTAACGAGAQNIDQFAYWDAIHPTARLQALWATGFASAIGLPAATSVPEPASLAVLGVGLIGLVAASRRQAGAGAGR